MKKYKKNDTVSLAVIGNQITYSLSPHIWQMFATEFGISINYLKILVNNDPIEFKQNVSQFFEDGGLAMSVTSPFKKNAYEIISHHTALSNFCKVGNLIYKNNDYIFTDTTDGVGLINDIENNHKIKLYNKINRAFLQKDVALRLSKCQEYLTQLNSNLYLLIYF